MFEERLPKQTSAINLGVENYKEFLENDISLGVHSFN
jgi:hypothetical protein